MKVGLVILAACGLLVAGCGGSTVNVSEQMSAGLGKKVDCSDAGLEEFAGEREQIYECVFTLNHVKTYTCMAVADSEIYVVRYEEC